MLDLKLRDLDAVLIFLQFQFRQLKILHDNEKNLPNLVRHLECQLYRALATADRRAVMTNRSIFGAAKKKRPRMNWADDFEVMDFMCFHLKRFRVRFNSSKSRVSRSEWNTALSLGI